MCLLWNECVFSDVFINHFPKIHRSVLRKINFILCSILFLRRLWRQSMRTKLRQKYGLFMQNKCLYVISSFSGKSSGLLVFWKETPKQLFSCWICETFKNSGGCFWKHVSYYDLITNYIVHKLDIFNAVVLLYCIYY